MSNSNSENQISTFFNENPTAKTVLKVGEELILAAYEQYAKDLARKKGLQVEVIKNPNRNGTE